VRSNAEYLISLPLSDLRAIKKSVAVLRRAGFSTDDALSIIIPAHQKMREESLAALRDRLSERVWKAAK
jgi:hypothetical protein